MENNMKRVYITDSSYDLLIEINSYEKITLVETLSNAIKVYKAKDISEYDEYLQDEQNNLAQLSNDEKEKFTALNSLVSNIKWYVHGSEIWAQIENEYGLYKGNANDPEILKIVCNCAMARNLDWSKKNNLLYVPYFIAICLLINHSGNFGIHPIDICQFMNDHVLIEKSKLTAELAKDSAIKQLEKVSKQSDFEKRAQKQLDKILERMTGTGTDLRNSSNELFKSVIRINEEGKLEKYKSLICDSYWNDIASCIKYGFNDIEAIDYAFYKHTPYF